MVRYPKPFYGLNAHMCPVMSVTLGGATLFLIFGVIYLYESVVASTEEFPIPIASDTITSI